MAEDDVTMTPEESEGAEEQAQEEQAEEQTVELVG